MVDAKDLFITPNYTLKCKDGSPNLRRYRAALDYSLDRIHLQQIHSRLFQDEDFYFKRGYRTYSGVAMVVTFKYAVCEWNLKGNDTYIRYGTDPNSVKLTDCACVRDGQLVAITLKQPVNNPVDSSLLLPYFDVRDGVYVQVKRPKLLYRPAEIREHLYANGFTCNGKRYVRWKRSAGSARVGKAMFIDERLIDEIRKWDLCGIEVDDHTPIDLAALESYVSLTSSSIIDTLHLEPKNILVINDYESTFTDDVVSVEERDGRLHAERKECEITNSIWDGQGLIDRSAMGKYSAKGMVLLRNQFFKCCCFNTNLQQWFRDRGITDVSQLNGSTEAERLEDIVLVTTPSSIKYLKFGSLEQWRHTVEPNFGVVKFDKTTHFFDGRMVQTHYQLINTLQMTQEEVDELVKPTLDYLTLIKNDPAVFRYHIKYPLEEIDLDYVSIPQNKNDIVFNLLGLNKHFYRTKIYQELLKDFIKAQVDHIKEGHILVNGNYSTIFGNPMEMLMATTGEFDGTPYMEKGTVQSTRFSYDKVLCGSRSPHITMSNVWLPTNRYYPDIPVYFNLTENILCLNSIGENVLQMLSGCDFDSDTVLLTDDRRIIAAAEKNKGVFPVAVTNVSSVKRKRECSPHQLADLDAKTSSNLIGDIVNLSQELNTVIWDRINNGATLDDVMGFYLDVCKLNAMSGLEIDSAKKEFLVQNSVELRVLRKKYMTKDGRGRKIKPSFFAAKDKKKGYYDTKKRNYAKHKTAMDYLQKALNSWNHCSNRIKKKEMVIPFHAIFDTKKFLPRDVSEAKISKVINIIQKEKNEEGHLFEIMPKGKERGEKLQLLRNECITKIGEMCFGESTMIQLLKTLEEEKYKSVYRVAVNILFAYPNKSFYKIVKKSEEPIDELVEDATGDIQIYDYRFKKQIAERKINRKRREILYRFGENAKKGA